MIDSSESENQGPAPGSTQYIPEPLLAADGPATVLSQGEARTPDVSPDGSADSELQRRLFPSQSSHDFIAPFDPRGVRLDHIRIEQMIGRGGMGAVFRATDGRLDRVVALKVLSPSFSRDPQTVERFRNEAKAAARLDHDNIARVYYSGEDRGLNFIAFEFVTGTNLRDLIMREGRLEPAEAVNYTLQIAAAVRHASSNGVVHRDIKPSNIIVTPSGRAKLVDLGLARNEAKEASADLTVAGTTLGTFDYISPEQAKDPRTVDVRSDIYSLGCTLYHMLTGEPPYPDGNFVQKLLDRQDRSPPDPALKAPQVGPELSALVQRMMAPRPRRRYNDADELLNDLMHVAGQLGLRGVHPEGLVWTHSSRLQKTRLWERHLGWIATAVVLLAAVFGVDYFSRPGNAKSEPVSGTPDPGDSGKSTPGKQVAKAPGKKPSNSGQKMVPPKNGAKKLPITFDQLGPGSWPVLPHAVGLHAAHGIARQMNVGRPGAEDAWARIFPGANDGSRATPGTGDPTKVAARKRPISLLKPDGASDRSYPSLEAACAAAADGDVIVLRFNGVRRSGDKPLTDKPVLVHNKRITIRAAAGFHPVIRFSGATAEATNPQTRMITVADSSVSVVGVHFEVHVDDDLNADNARWTLFSLRGSDHVRLRGVRVLINNPNARLAAVFEISPKRGPNLTRMKMMKKSSATPDRFEIKLADSIVQGECDLLAAVHPRPGMLETQHAAAILGGSVLMVHVDDAVEAMPEGDRIDLKLEHTTALLGEGVDRRLGKERAFRLADPGIVPQQPVQRDHRKHARHHGRWRTDRRFSEPAQMGRGKELL